MEVPWFFHDENAASAGVGQAGSGEVEPIGSLPDHQLIKVKLGGDWLVYRQDFSGEADKSDHGDVPSDTSQTRPDLPYLCFRAGTNCA